jgi:F0F1-type ATP synthase assembly protein I
VPVLRGVQENVHKTQLAISQIPDSRAKQVATAFAANAAAGIDQVVGAPPQADLVVWQSLVDRLLSENAAIRAKADSDNAAAEGRLVTVSTKLAAVAADRDEYQRKFNAQAAEAIAQQATIRKYEWIAGAVLALWLLGQILAKAAQANPIFEGASALVNTVVAPGVKAALSDAKQTIQGVGKAIGVVQSTMTPAAASSLATNIAAAVPNQNHVSAIAGAAAAISGSTTSIPKTT